MLRLLAIALAASLAAACRPADDRMNLVMICIDTVRADRFFAPVLDDELTAPLGEAQRYTQAMTTSPWTIPAVASVITGLYPPAHGAGRFEGPVANLNTETPTALDPELHTLAEIMSEDGYQTQGFVAHPWFASGFGLEQGFEEVQYGGDAGQITGRFAQWLSNRKRRRPYFAYLHFMEAHDWHKKKKTPELKAMLAAYPEETRELLGTLVNPAVCRNPNRPICVRNMIYAAAILSLRETVARLIEDLRERAELENTLIVLYSDHGEEFRENVALHRQLYEDPRDIYGGGHGQTHFEALLRVPLVVWHPGHEGARHDNLVSLVDVFPSLLEWLELDAGGGELPGELLPVGPQPAASIADERAVFASNIAFGPESIAIVKERNKAWYWPATDRWLFFDRIEDPGEKQPLEDERLLLEFTTLAGDYLEMRSDYGTTRPELDREQLRVLQSIGYLQGAEADEE